MYDDACATTTEYSHTNAVYIFIFYTLYSGVRRIRIVRIDRKESPYDERLFSIYLHKRKPPTNWQPVTAK